MTAPDIQGARANQLTYDQQMQLSVIASLAEQYLMGGEHFDGGEAF